MFVLTEERIREVLKPLEEASRADYLHQYQKLSDFNHRLQNIETLYAEVYTQIAALEQQIINMKQE